MTLSEYSHLKQAVVLSAGRAERHSEILSAIKELFKVEINSIRRFEQIKTIGQLLHVLEVRDILSEDNVECLKMVAQKLPNSKEILKKITEYVNCHVPREYENYYVPAQHSKTEQRESFITVSSMSSRKKQRIFQTIIEDIGSHWRDLGRNLDIKEVKIDDIDLQYKTVNEKATEIMNIYEYKMADPDKWFFILCEALEKSYRKDIVRDLQAIITMNI